MKYMIYLLAAMYIIGGLAVIKLFMVPENIDINKIKDSIVIIIPEQELISYKNNPKGLFKENKTSGIGLGFFTNDEGIIVTSNHIIEDDTIKYKVISNGKEYISNVFFRNLEKDIANLMININDINNFKWLKSSNKTSTGELIYSFGVDTENLEIIYNTGIILNKKSKLDNMSNLLEISNTLKPGFSGGPIVNSKGKVIGINYAISEGKNYGIKF